MPPTLLNGREVAAHIDATYDDVMSWARRGIIPSIRAGGRVYFNLGRVIEAIRERQHPPAEVAAQSA